MAEEPLDHAEGARLPEAAPPTNHGHTVAAWVTVSVVMLGAVLAAAGVLASVMVLFWAGLVVCALGAVAGRVLRAMGLGQASPAGPRRGGAGSGSDVGARG